MVINLLYAFLPQLTNHSRCHIHTHYTYHWRHIRAFIITGLLCCPIRRLCLQFAQSDWHRIWYIFRELAYTHTLTYFIAAHFVQTTVATYEQYYGNISSTSDVTEQEGKECSNMLVLISELYNFQVISSVLVFDIIRNLLDGNLTEFKVELLLKIVRSMFFLLSSWWRICYTHTSCAKIPDNN